MSDIYYETKLGKLFRGDCLDVMDKLIEDGVKVDAIICDPPYGTIKNFQTNENFKHGLSKPNSWDVKIDTFKMFERCEKLLREKGTLILFGQDPYSNELKNINFDNLKYCYSMIWEKDHFANSLIAKKAPLKLTEDILVFDRQFDKYNENPLRLYFQKLYDFIGLKKLEILKTIGQSADHCFRKTKTFKPCNKETYIKLINTYSIDKMDGFLEYRLIIEINSRYKSIFNLWDGKKYKSNILKYKKDYDGYHITQKPILFIEDLIKTYSNEGDLILDFTSGSGTLAVACENTNRKWICIEKDEDKDGNSLGYCDITVKRLKGELKLKK